MTDLWVSCAMNDFFEQCQTVFLDAVFVLITGAQPKAGTGLKMQTVRFFNVTLLGIYR